jgi:hypothetical protein
MSGQIGSISRAGRMRASVHPRPALIMLVFAIMAAMAVTAVRPADAAQLNGSEILRMPYPTSTPIAANGGTIRN